VRVADVLVKRLEARLTPEEADLEALQNEPAVAHLGFSAEELLRMWPQLRAASTDSPYAESDGHSTLHDVRPRIRATSPDQPLDLEIPIALAAPPANDTTPEPPARPAWVIPAAAAGGLAVLAAIAAALFR
jgi:hypothetical protein